MNNVSAYIYIISASLVVILSYIYNQISQKKAIPSVLLLLVTGIAIRELLIYNDFTVAIPATIVELFGILGLIMIILEAGLDLKIYPDNLKLIRNAFFSALIILILSATACSLFLHYYLRENYLHCLIYAIPLSIVSSAIVIPSISHLSNLKKEFLVYETSFSDILGILLFNYIIAGNMLNWRNISLFFGSLALSIVLSVVLSILMLLMLTRITSKIRFSLLFAILIFLYAGGKMLHLPALFIILVFGLMVANWQLPFFEEKIKIISLQRVNKVSHFLHSLTAESSFIIRTFFFFIFGLTINLRLLQNAEVILTGSVIVLMLLAIRYIYLKFFLNSHIFPELFYMPRGLITILLFYKIPEIYKLSKFNEGVLFFVILITSVIMMIGSISYGKPQVQVINDDAPI